MLVVVWDHPRSMDRDLVAVVDTLARMSSQALRRTQLSARSQEIALFTRDLAMATEVADVRHVVGHHLRSAFGADKVELELGGTATTDGSPVPVWHDGCNDDGRTDAAWVVIPMTDSAGAAAGQCRLQWPYHRYFDQLTRSTLTTTVDVTAQTLERIGHVDRETAAARRSQAVAELGEVIATSSTEQDVAGLVVAAAHDTVGADACEVVLDDDRSGPPVPAGEVPRWDADLPAGHKRAGRTQPSTCPSPTPGASGWAGSPTAGRPGSRWTLHRPRRWPGSRTPWGGPSSASA